LVDEEEPLLGFRSVATKNSGWWWKKWILNHWNFAISICPSSSSISLSSMLRHDLDDEAGRRIHSDVHLSLQGWHVVWEGAFQIATRIFVFCFYVLQTNLSKLFPFYLGNLSYPIIQVQSQWIFN
jgi:hypothetical protein